VETYLSQLPNNSPPAPVLSPTLFEDYFCLPALLLFGPCIISIRQFSIIMRAPTTRIFGDHSWEPISTCASVYSIYCIKSLILWTGASVNCIGKGWLVSKNQSYRYDDEDLAGLLTSLRDRSFSHNGTQYSLSQINDLRHSKHWKERCNPLLKKIILTIPTK
jgi:hypothetical protein